VTLPVFPDRATGVFREAEPGASLAGSSTHSLLGRSASDPHRRHGRSARDYVVGIEVPGQRLTQLRDLAPHPPLRHLGQHPGLRSPPIIAVRIARAETDFPRPRMSVMPLNEVSRRGGARA
jgi:hypothetical protein